MSFRAPRRVELDERGDLWVWSAVEESVREAVLAEPATLRALLHRLNVQVTLYWRPDGGRYHLLENALMKADFGEGFFVPIYEYQCKPCGAKFEKLVRTMSSTEAVKCPECGSEQTARALSVFAVSSEGGAKSSAAGGGDLPMCGRCGGPGPCAMG